MNQYRGRFAPSPTGPLHFGSLFAAVISYLDARSHGGAWLLRIDDIDPPRESLNAKSEILKTLETHGLYWDESPSYQSRHSDRYEQALEQLHAAGHTYYCLCSRKHLENSPQHLPGCGYHHKQASSGAIKFRAQHQPTLNWLDIIQGPLSYRIAQDFSLKRRDSLYAYQLACTIDDAEQHISHVIRGADLIDSTPMQLALFQALNLEAPQYGHFPVIVNQQGQKLSKQNLARAVDNSQAHENLLVVLSLLGIPLPHAQLSIEETLQFAIAQWPQVQLPQALSIPET